MVCLIREKLYSFSLIRVELYRLVFNPASAIQECEYSYTTGASKSLLTEIEIFCCFSVEVKAYTPNLYPRKCGSNFG